LTKLGDKGDGKAMCSIGGPESEYQAQQFRNGSRSEHWTLDHDQNLAGT